MSVFIRRKKMLFEADENQSLNQQPVSNQLSTDVNNLNNQQVLATELQQKVTSCINNITLIILKNDPYALIALDLPSLIQSQVPEFKADNASAKDAIDTWNSFKQNANKENFDKFVNSFATFGNSDLQNTNNQQQTLNQLNQQPQNQNNNQTNAPVVNNQQNLNDSNANNQQPLLNQTNNTLDISNSLKILTNHLQGESVNNQFRDMLKENLQASLKKDRYEDILKNGWQDPDKIFC